MGAGIEKGLTKKFKENISREEYNIIWIGPEVHDKNNSDFLKELKTLNYIFLQNTKDAIILIKDFKFENICIIIYEKLCKEFIENFEENINDIYIIPKIILLLDNKEKFMNENKEYINNNPFYFNYMATNLNEIQNIIKNPQKEKNNQEFVFEYKDMLKLINMNKDIAFFIQILDNKYSKSNRLSHLINQIKYLDYIPLELLSKYFLRIYTEESEFYRDVNMNLQQNKLLYYSPYISVLYEGIKLKSLPVKSHNILFGSTQISKDEFQFLLNKLNNKKENILTNKIVSKTFLLFTERIDISLKFLRRRNKDIISIFFELEKDNNIDLNNISFSNTTKISAFPNEKEVLFFPFSSFEIKSIKKKNLDNENIYYKIKLKYLGYNNSSKELLFNSYFSNNDLNKELSNKKVIDDQNELKKKLKNLTIKF